MAWLCLDQSCITITMLHLRLDFPLIDDPHSPLRSPREEAREGAPWSLSQFMGGIA